MFKVNNEVNNEVNKLRAAWKPISFFEAQLRNSHREPVRCCLFNRVSQHKMPTLNDSIAQCVTNGWICTSLKVLPMPNFWQPDGYGNTITSGLTQQSEAYRLDN